MHEGGIPSSPASVGEVTKVLIIGWWRFNVFEIRESLCLEISTIGVVYIKYVISPRWTSDVL
jgi:hypothetical protein